MIRCVQDLLGCNGSLPKDKRFESRSYMSRYRLTTEFRESPGVWPFLEFYSGLGLEAFFTSNGVRKRPGMCRSDGRQLLRCSFLKIGSRAETAGILEQIQTDSYAEGRLSPRPLPMAGFSP